MNISPKNHQITIGILMEVLVVFCKNNSMIEFQMIDGRNIDVKTKIDYYSRLSVCGENDSDTETFYFL